MLKKCIGQTGFNSVEPSQLFQTCIYLIGYKLDETKTLVENCVDKCIFKSVLVIDEKHSFRKCLNEVAFQLNGNVNISKKCIEENVFKTDEKIYMFNKYLDQDVFKPNENIETCTNGSTLNKFEADE